MWPCDSIRRHRTGSTLAHVMACCLMAPSHYLNQCWLIISKVQWQSSEGKFTRDTSAINHWNSLENYLPDISLKSPRDQWVNPSAHIAGGVIIITLVCLSIYPSLTACLSNNSWDFQSFWSLIPGRYISWCPGEIMDKTAAQQICA